MTNKLEILSKIDEEEVEILKGERFVKYLYEAGDDRSDGNIYIKAGLEAEPEDLLQSIYAIIYSTYQGLKVIRRMRILPNYLGGRSQPT